MYAVRWPDCAAAYGSLGTFTGLEGVEFHARVLLGGGIRWAGALLLIYVLIMSR
jgi:hypothetical protein